MSTPPVGSDRGPQLVRAVGFWGLVAMCINAVVGSGVFLLPSESYKLLGPFSLWAPLLFAIPVFILVLCFAEATSHFSEPGGAFLYAGTAFGDFIGFETGWMNWLARITSLAALSNGFVISLGRLWPTANETGPRAALIVGTLGALAAIHFVGVRYGAATIYALTAAKLFPLLLFIVVALALFPNNPIPASLDLPGPGTDWSEAALLLLFAYAGFENLGVPAGEYRNPRRDLPLALLVGILGIAALYSLAQLAAMAALPDLGATKTPIADAAAALMGPAGALLVTAGAMASILGTNSGTMLEGSRMLYALSLGRRPFRAVSFVHPRYRTPGGGDPDPRRRRHPARPRRHLRQAGGALGGGAHVHLPLHLRRPAAAAAAVGGVPHSGPVGAAPRHRDLARPLPDPEARAPSGSAPGPGGRGAALGPGKAV